jgi:hypothetical protein
MTAWTQEAGQRRDAYMDVSGRATQEAKAEQLPRKRSFEMSFILCGVHPHITNLYSYCAWDE